MRKNLITLVTFFGGVLYAAIWLPIVIFTINYREIGLGTYYSLILVLLICLYNVGIYISATLFKWYSKRQVDIVPSALAIGSIAGSILGYLILTSPFPLLNFLKSPILFLFPIVGIRVACAFEFYKYTSVIRPLLNISTVVAISLILHFVFIGSRSDFPGVNASSQIRQKWAYEEFSDYSYVVRSIGLCNPITDKVGKIKFIAPTKGRNIHVAEAGSGDSAEYTLEVVGEKGTGIAYGRGRFGGLGDISFEFHGKKSRVSCVRS